MLDYSALLIAGFVVMTGSCLQGATGLGLAQLAAPTLTLLDPRLVPVPIAFCGLLLLLLMSARERHAVSASGIGWALAGCLPGTVAGAALLAAVTGAGLNLTCGVVILAGVAASVCGWAPYPTRPALLVAGLASGFMGATTATAGPPMGLVYQRSRGARLRATLSAFFVAGNVFALATLALAGQIHGFQLKASGWLLPFTVAGFAVSSPARRILDRGYVRPVVLSLSAASATALIVKAIL